MQTVRCESLPTFHPRVKASGIARSPAVFSDNVSDSILRTLAPLDVRPTRPIPPIISRLHSLCESRARHCGVRSNWARSAAATPAAYAPHHRRSPRRGALRLRRARRQMMLFTSYRSSSLKGSWNTAHGVPSPAVTGTAPHQHKKFTCIHDLELPTGAP